MCLEKVKICFDAYLMLLKALLRNVSECMVFLLWKVIGNFTIPMHTA